MGTKCALLYMSTRVQHTTAQDYLEMCCPLVVEITIAIPDCQLSWWIPRLSHDERCIHNKLYMSLYLFMYPPSPTFRSFDIATFDGFNNTPDQMHPEYILQNEVFYYETWAKYAVLYFFGNIMLIGWLLCECSLCLKIQYINAIVSKWNFSIKICWKH